MFAPNGGRVSSQATGPKSKLGKGPNVYHWSAVSHCGGEHSHSGKTRPPTPAHCGALNAAVRFPNPNGSTGTATEVKKKSLPRAPQMPAFRAKNSPGCEKKR